MEREEYLSYVYYIYIRVKYVHMYSFIRPFSYIPFFKFIAPLRERIRRRLGLPFGPGISLDTL